jgi:hypothetical protein
MKCNNFSGSSSSLSGSLQKVSTQILPPPLSLNWYFLSAQLLFYLLQKLNFFTNSTLEWFRSYNSSSKFPLPLPLPNSFVKIVISSKEVHFCSLLALHQEGVQYWLYPSCGSQNFCSLACTMLCQIFRLSFYFNLPFSLKTCSHSACAEKGWPLQPFSYCPISLTSVLSKFLVKSRNDFKSNVIIDRQYGFRKKQF